MNVSSTLNILLAHCLSRLLLRYGETTSWLILRKFGACEGQPARLAWAALPPTVVSPLIKKRKRVSLFSHQYKVCSDRRDAVGSPCFAVVLPLDSQTKATGGRSAWDTIHTISSKITAHHNTPHLSPSILLCKRALSPLDATVETLQLQVSAWRAEEVERRRFPTIPVRTEPGTGSIDVTLDGAPLFKANPSWVDGKWTPTPFLLPVVGLWAGRAEGDAASIEVEPGDTYIRVELEDTLEVRGLVGALQTDPSKIASRGAWRTLFDVFRDPDHFQCPAPGVLILKSSRMSIDRARGIVDDLAADGTFVDGGVGRASVGGVSEFKCDRLHLMKGSDEDGWERVAQFSLV